MKKFKKVFAIAFAACLTFTFIACGSTKDAPVIDDQAAVRGQDEGAGEFWIDDEAIALAGSAASSQAALDACQAVFNLINQNRVANGLSALVWSEALKNAAQVRAIEITDAFSHIKTGDAEASPAGVIY